jgi:hypothetical protein
MGLGRGFQHPQQCSVSPLIGPSLPPPVVVLRHGRIMSFFPKAGEEAEFAKELENLPDRVAGLLLVTIVDERLGEALKARWYDIKIEQEQLFDRMFRYDGPAGSFGTRIDFGFAVGLFGEDALKDLHIMRKVRNAFAHRIGAKDFNAQQVKDLTNNLQMPKKYPIKLGPREIGMLTSPDNPTPIQLAETLLGQSSVKNIETPRNKFIRAAEILSGLLTAAIPIGLHTKPARIF